MCQEQASTLYRTSDIMRQPQHRRLAKWEPLDEIRLRVVPRYKTSELSGDEWRLGCVVELYHKGEIVAEQQYTSVQAAKDYLPAFMSDCACPIPMRVIDLERDTCDQPSCKNKAVSRYRIKKLYSDCGEELAQHDYPWPYFYRQFCAVHLRRGDCGLEDADRNYEVVSGPGPGETANVQESPAAFGGVVEVDTP